MLQKLFEPALGYLRQRLASFERQSAEVRTLIEMLIAHARVAEPIRAARARARPPRGRPRSRRAGTPKRVTAQLAPRAVAVAGENGAAKEIGDIVAAIAQSRRDAEAAIGSKDVAKLKTAVTAIAHAERRGGELLAKLGGKLKPLPVAHAVRKRWRETAARSPTEFEAKLKRDVARALARLGGKAADAVGKAKTTKPAPREPRAKLSEWQREPDGSLTRTLASVEDAAAAPAGAA